jgi:GNAT superfamily N-acetyltransferase
VAIPADYVLWSGSGLDRALLVKFMQRTYQELYPDQSFAHLAQTVEQYFSKETPLWWVGQADSHNSGLGTGSSVRSPVACLWLGNAIDQVRGDRHSHIFLLYVLPTHRRKGIGSALMHHAEEWARVRGDRQMGLQVFVANQPAINLYQKLGYTPQSVWMVKPLL